jgi:hypothetical protein
MVPLLFDLKHVNMVPIIRCRHMPTKKKSFHKLFHQSISYHTVHDAERWSTGLVMALSSSSEIMPRWDGSSSIILATSNPRWTTSRTLSGLFTDVPPLFAVIVLRPAVPRQPHLCQLDGAPRDLQPPGLYARCGEQPEQHYIMMEQRTNSMINVQLS